MSSPYLVRATSESFGYHGIERVFPEREEAVRYAEGMRTHWDVKVSQGGKPVPLSGDECPTCGAVWDCCDGCGKDAYCVRAADAPDGTVPVCGECACTTCRGGPRQLAHYHCPKHGGCR